MRGPHCSAINQESTKDPVDNLENNPKPQRKNRSRLQIVADILQVAKNGSNKTRIMYQANLSFELLRRYVDFLKRSGLLQTVDRDGKSYVTTEKGHRFLEEYDELRRYSEIVESKRHALEHDLEAKD